jgi:hypothetical protein
MITQRVEVIIRYVDDEDQVLSESNLGFQMLDGDAAIVLRRRLFRFYFTKKRPDSARKSDCSYRASGLYAMITNSCDMCTGPLLRRYRAEARPAVSVNADPFAAGRAWQPRLPSKVAEACLFCAWALIRRRVLAPTIGLLMPAQLHIPGALSHLSYRPHSRLCPTSPDLDYVLCFLIPIS